MPVLLPRLEFCERLTGGMLTGERGGGNRFVRQRMGKLVKIRVGGAREGPCCLEFRGWRGMGSQVSVYLIAGALS